MESLRTPRTPWPSDFPPVFVHADLAARDHHPALSRAKAGDRMAALRLVLDLMSRETWHALHATAGDEALLLPVTALESDGFNAIPDAMVFAAGVVIDNEMQAGKIVQANRVGHTRASGWHRLVTPALFEGPVQSGRNYILVDDHVGLGGTLANLRGFVEDGGGRVVAMTTLTETRDARVIAVRPETLSVLQERHGQALEILWRDVFGYGLDSLTELEAGYLARQLSVDAIREGLASAAELARGRGLPAVDVQTSG